jgi:adenylylsulfate kinase-like enzyme
LETDKLRRWLGLEIAAGHQYNPNILWLHGNPGTGKSTLAITMTEELPNQQYFASGDKTLAYFFCHATSEK